MKCNFNTLTVFLFLISMLGGSIVKAQSAESFIIKNVNIVNVETGKVLLNQDVFIENGKVSQINRSGNKKTTLRTIDGSGKFLIPGLWDFHVHALAFPEEDKFSLPVYVANGVTGIRDLGSFRALTELKEIQNAAQQNKLVSPRIVLTGAVVDGPPGAWQGVRVAKTREEGIREAEKLLDEGWQYLKTYSLLPLEAYQGVAETARKRNVPLIGHIPNGVTVGQAIEAGHRVIEHIDSVLLGCSTKEAEVVADRAKIIASGDLQALFTSFRQHKDEIFNSIDWQQCEQLAETMAKNKLFVVPTMVVSDFYQGKDPAAGDTRFRSVPAPVRGQWSEADRRRAGYTKEDYEFAAKVHKLDLKLLEILKRKGVWILAGSDAGWINPYIFHGYSILDEIERFATQAKFTPAEALQTATTNPARFLEGENKFGKIEKGFAADLVLLDANPLENIKNIRRVNTVILRGRIFDRKALDQILADVEKQAGQGEGKD